MFYGKRIDNLEFEIQKLNFKLNNPPQFKVGDKPRKGFVLTEVKYKHIFGIEFLGSFHCRQHEMFYVFVNIKTGKSHQISSDYLLNFLKPTKSK